MITNRVKVLLAEKEIRENRRITYRTMASETGLSTTTIVAYVNQRIVRYDASVLVTLCKYFECQPGDLLVYKKDEE